MLFSLAIAQLKQIVYKLDGVKRDRLPWAGDLVMSLLVNAYTFSDLRSRELLQEFGSKWSNVLFMQLDSLGHPHYPQGRLDNTHFNVYGAGRLAQLVLAEIRKQKLELAERITQKAAP